MNPAQLSGVARILLPLIAYFGHKYLPPDLVSSLPEGWEQDVFMAGVTMFAVVWSFKDNSAEGIARRAVAILQDHPLHAVKVSNALAPSPAPSTPPAGPQA